MNKLARRSVSLLCILAIAFTMVFLPNNSKDVMAASNPYEGGYSNCTWGAWQLCYEATGHALPGWGNAKTWLDYARKAGYSTGTTPQVNSIAVWTSGTTGHVAWVYKVEGNTIYIKEGGYHPTAGAPAQYNERKITNPTVAGYIYIGHTHDYNQCTVSKAPTASSTGTWTLKCSCGATTTETIPAIPDAKIRDGVYRIAARTDSSMYVSVTPYQSYQEGNIALYKRGVADQDFLFKKNSDGKYTISYGSFVLDVCGGNYQGTVWLYSSNGSDAQKWYVVSAGNGYYRLVNKALYLNLDICGNWMDPGTDIRSWIHNGSEAQTFKLELVECSNHTWDNGTVTKQPGIGTTGTKKYTCTACGHTKTETIPALISISDAKVSVASATYTGSAVTPAVTVTVNSKTLVKGTDYTVTYANNNKVGTGSVTITGKGSYSGTKTVAFTISEPTYSWKSESGKWYLYDNTGRKITGFMTLDGQTFYMDGNGVMQTEWKQISGAWYYFGGSGVMRKGWQQISGSWYFFNVSNGQMLKNWQQIGGFWYYFGESGSMKTGWQQIGGTWYYFESSGHMAKGWQKISSIWYYFGDSGSMKTGWQKISGKWYYFASSGAMQTGWLNQSGKWYWLGTDGSMVYSTGVTISGKTYYFDLNGVCLNP